MAGLQQYRHTHMHSLSCWWYLRLGGHKGARMLSVTALLCFLFLLWAPLGSGSSIWGSLGAYSHVPFWTETSNPRIWKEHMLATPPVPWAWREIKFSPEQCWAFPSQHMLSIWFSWSCHLMNFNLCYILLFTFKKSKKGITVPYQISCQLQRW